MRIITLLVVLLVCFINIGSATIWYVGTSNADYIVDGVNDEVQIQQAIDNSSNGDIVQLNNSVALNNNISGSESISMNKEIIFRGINSSIVLSHQSSIEKMINISASNVTVSNFSINTTYTNRNYESCICIMGGTENTLLDNIYSVVGEPFAYKYGIQTIYSEGIIVKPRFQNIQMARGFKIQYADNAIFSNIILNGSFQTPTDFGGTVGMLEMNREVHNLTLKDSNIGYCSNSAIYFHGGNDNNTLENVTASGGSLGAILFDDPNTNTYIYNSTIEDSAVGIYFNFIAGDYSNNLTIRNTIFDNLNTGILTDKDGSIKNTDIKNSIISRILNNSIVLHSGVDGFNLSNSIIYDWGISDYAINQINNATNLSIEYNNIFDPDDAVKYNNSESNNTIVTNPYFYDLDTFRLNSTVGTWNGTGWEVMSTHSPCIDTGNPTDDYSNEPSPNGSRINMGIYGNTEYASKSTITDVETFVVVVGAFVAAVFAGVTVVVRRIRRRSFSNQRVRRR